MADPTGDLQPITAKCKQSTLWPLALKYVRERTLRGEIEPITARNVRNHLRCFAVSFGQRPLSQLNRRAVERWLEQNGHLAPSTRRLQLGSVRMFCLWLIDQRLIKVDPTARVAKIRQPRKVPRAQNEEAIAALLDACSSARERAIVWLMVGLGLRCVEVTRLEVADWDRLDQTVRVRGKGGHERILPVTEAVAQALNAYTAETGEIGGALIRSELNPAQGIGSSRLSGLVGQIIRRAGLKRRPYDGVGAHALRATAASDVLARSGDITVVREMLGHVNIQTTSIYLRRAQLDDMRTAMEGRTYRPGAAPPSPTEQRPRLDLEALAPQGFRDEATLLAATLDLHTETLQRALNTGRRACAEALAAAREPLSRARIMLDIGQTATRDAEAAVAALGVSLGRDAHEGLSYVLWAVTGLDDLATALCVLGDVAAEVWDRWAVADTIVEQHVAGWTFPRAS